MFLKVRSLLCGWFLLVVAAPLQAEEAVPQLMPQWQWQISMAVGYGQYGTMLYDEQDSTLLVLPRWSVYHHKFYMENLDLGWNLFESESFSVDLSTKQNFDALAVRDRHAEDALIKSIALHEVALPILWNETVDDVVNLKQRHLSYFAGLSTFSRWQHLELRSEWHRDISGVHGGHEWNNLLRAQHQIGPVAFVPTLGLRRLDRKLANYYFGLGYHETTDLLSRLPGAMWLPSLKLDSSWQINADLRLLVSLKREYFPSKVTDSLFVGQRSHDIWFIGLLYQW